MHISKYWKFSLTTHDIVQSEQCLLARVQYEVNTKMFYTCMSFANKNRQTEFYWQLTEFSKV